MIEITAKQLYDIYKELETIKVTDRLKYALDSVIEFVMIDGEWKPTTDLIIKA